MVGRLFGVLGLSIETLIVILIMALIETLIVILIIALIETLKVTHIATLIVNPYSSSLGE